MSQDPWRTRLLVDWARRGHRGAQEELRWLHRPKMIRVVSSIFPGGEHRRRDARDLADQLLSRGFAELDRFEYRGAASLWPFLRARARRALLGLHGGGAAGVGDRERRGEKPREAPAWSSVGRPPLEVELERDALDRWLRIVAGARARRAILLRLNLALSYGEIAGECRYGSSRQARDRIIDGLTGTVAAMARHRPRDARRWALERRILAVVDHPHPSSIDELLASHHLRRTRASWIEEESRLFVPTLMSRHFGALIRRLTS